MKLISTLYVAITIGVCALSWRYVEPLVSSNGTSVIHANVDGQRGGQPLSLKLPENMTKKQHELLNFAYEVAKDDGIKHPQILQGVLIQESRVGGMKEFRVAGLENKPGDRYFGIGQIKLAAAKDVLKKFPDLWKVLQTKTDEELQARLILDDKFNIRVASKYMLMLGINRDPTFAITAYNRGPGGAQAVDPQTWHYTVKVKHYSNKLEGKSK